MASAFGIAAGATSAFGNILGGISGYRSDRQSAKNLSELAGQTETVGAMTADILRKKGKQAVSSARAQYGASGIDVNSGTAQVVQKEITQNAEMDALTAILQSKIESRAMRNEASKLKNRAKQQLISGILGAGGNIAQGLS